MLSVVLDYAAGTSNERNGQAPREWLRYVVLWRHPQSFGMRGTRATNDTAALRSATMRYRDLKRAAEDNRRNFLGLQRGPLILRAELSEWNSDTLVVGSRQYLVPKRDSALVVMVDASDTTDSAVRIIGEAYIPAMLPEEAVYKTWTSGDTTYSVRPRLSHTEALRVMLRAHPIVRTFVDSAEAGLPPRRVRNP